MKKISWKTNKTDLYRMIPPFDRLWRKIHGKWSMREVTRCKGSLLFCLFAVVYLAFRVTTHLRQQDWWAAATRCRIAVGKTFESVCKPLAVWWKKNRSMQANSWAGLNYVEPELCVASILWLLNRHPMINLVRILKWECQHSIRTTYIWMRCILNLACEQWWILHVNISQFCTWIVVNLAREP